MSDLNLFLAEANPDFKIVVVQFPTSSKNYHYKTILDVQPGDKVVVDAPSTGYTVLDVVEVIPALETELSYNFQIKWVVDKVDVEQYEKVQLMEREATKTLNQLKYTRRRKELLEDLKSEVGAEGIETVKKLVRL